MTDFEKKSLENTLGNLLENGVIEPSQKEKLMEAYSNDNRTYNQIHEEIYKLRYDKVLLDKVLTNNIAIADKKLKDVDITKKDDVHLNLENVEEFTKEDVNKTYIKIHYPYPDDKVEILEKGPNLQGYDAKEIFTEVQKKTGVENATNIFKDVLKDRCTEIKADDMEEYCKQTEFEKLTLEQKKTVIAIKKKPEYADKKITASPEENIFVISEPAVSTSDKVVTVTKKLINGKEEYVITPIQQNGYKYENSENTQSKDDEKYSEEMDENEEIEKLKDDEELVNKGRSIVMKRKKKKPSEAAFVNMLWFVILIGIICAIAIAAVLTKFYY